MLYPHTHTQAQAHEIHTLHNRYSYYYTLARSKSIKGINLIQTISSRGKQSAATPTSIAVSGFFFCKKAPLGTDASAFIRGLPFELIVRQTALDYIIEESKT